MIDVNSFLEKFLPLLKVTFGERLWFVGLQGSYARGEATENSDIDIVVILDELTAENIPDYSEIVGKCVNGIIDRPIGRRHPDYPDIVYTVNYGYIPEISGGDGEAQDVGLSDVSLLIVVLLKWSE